MPILHTFKRVGRRFLADQQGTASLEFVIVFPIFFGFFLMTYESGMISAQQVMLERGVDIAVRDVRIGAMANPTPDSLRARICDVAMILEDCENQLQIEMIVKDPRNWTAVPATIQCIDRGAVTQPTVTFTNGGNNELVFLRACARIDPALPGTGLGKAIRTQNSGAAAGGSLALVATSAFVIEPFNLMSQP